MQGVRFAQVFRFREPNAWRINAANVRKVDVADLSIHAGSKTRDEEAEGGGFLPFSRMNPMHREEFNFLSDDVAFVARFSGLFGLVSAVVAGLRVMPRGQSAARH